MTTGRGLCPCGCGGSAAGLRRAPAPSTRTEAGGGSVPGVFRDELTEQDPVGEPVGQDYSGGIPGARMRKSRGPSAEGPPQRLPLSPTLLPPRSPIRSSGHILLEMISVLA